MEPTRMTLVLLLRGDPDRQVLLGRKLRGFGKGKVVGLGGKIEPGEGAAAAAAREVREECGLELCPRDLVPAGQLRFRFPARPDWVMDVDVFRCEVGEGAGQARQTSDEVAPQWFAVDALPRAQMWDDNHYWLLPVLGGASVDADITFAPDNEFVASASLRFSRGARREAGLR